MMYKVKATLIQSKAKEFLTHLQDGTIESQQPDGPEIVASMKRATLDGEGWVNWTEVCYCSPPLAHERVTWLDTYFEKLETQPIEGYETFKGKPFMEHLRDLVDKESP